MSAPGRKEVPWSPDCHPSGGPDLPPLLGSPWFLRLVPLFRPSPLFFLNRCWSRGEEAGSNIHAAVPVPVHFILPSLRLLNLLGSDKEKVLNLEKTLLCVSTKEASHLVKVKRIGNTLIADSDIPLGGPHPQSGH